MIGGWPSSLLGDVCTVIAGQSPKASFYNEHGQGLPFYQGKKEFSERLIRQPRKWTTFVTKEAESGDILMSVRAPVGPINQATEKICIGRGLAAIRPHGGLSRDYVWYALLWLQPSIRGNAGAVFESINKMGIERLRIPVPPLEERQRIVAVLDEAFEGLDRAHAHAEANAHNARELFSVAIENALQRVGGKLVTLSRLLEDGWVLSHLDGNHGSNYPRKDEFVYEGVPYISANCIVENAIDMSRCKFLTRERADVLRKGVAQDRDVIFAHNATVGPVALLSTNEPKVILSTSLTFYRCDEKRLRPEFLVYEMRSAGFRQQYEEVMEQATRNQVPITTQRKFRHLIPSMDDQCRIADLGIKLEQNTRQLEGTYRRALIDLGDLRQSILQRAFTGELT